MLGLKIFLTLSHPLSIKTEQIIQYQTFWELRIKQKQKSSGKDEASLLITAWVNEESRR